jgi:hypothetical protein
VGPTGTLDRKRVAFDPQLFPSGVSPPLVCDALHAGRRTARAERCTTGRIAADSRARTTARALRWTGAEVDMTCSSKFPTMIAIACSLIGCVGGAPDDGFGPRPSPELETNGASLRPADSVLDARRDGVFARAIDDETVAVYAMRAADPQRLFDAEGYGPSTSLGHLASRSDDDVLLATRDDGTDRFWRWDGETTSDVTTRMLAPLILAHETDQIGANALDIDDDGTVIVAMGVGGQGVDAPMSQLCVYGLAPEADACESMDVITGMPEAIASDVAISAGRIFVVAEGLAFVRAPGGAWTALRVPATNVRVLDDGRVAIVTETDGGSVVRTFASGGAETQVTLASVFSLEGHSHLGLWTVWNALDGDGSCTGIDFSGSCHEEIVRSRVVVQHATLDGAVTEVGHATFDDDSALSPLLTPLANGDLRLDTMGAHFFVARPE